VLARLDSCTYDSFLQTGRGRQVDLETAPHVADAHFFAGVFEDPQLDSVIIAGREKRKKKEKKRKTLLLSLFKAEDGDVKDEASRKWYFWALFNVCALLYLTLFTELILFWAVSANVFALNNKTDGSLQQQN
jgi:hypothetical protein